MSVWFGGFFETNEVMSRGILQLRSFGSMCQPFEMEIASLCHDFWSSTRRCLNDVSTHIDNARQLLQVLVQTLHLLEGDLLLSSDDECKIL